MKLWKLLNDQIFLPDELSSTQKISKKSTKKEKAEL
jgi:hypothetical protein